MGAEWAWKVSRGAMALPLQVASLYEEFGAMTKCCPVLRPLVNEEGSQTEKQVG